MCHGASAQPASEALIFGRSLIDLKPTPRDRPQPQRSRARRVAVPCARRAARKRFTHTRSGRGAAAGETPLARPAFSLYRADETCRTLNVFSLSRGEKCMRIRTSAILVFRTQTDLGIRKMAIAAAQLQPSEVHCPPSANYCSDK